ncbi:protein TIFY 8-like isoform X2 [Momordica charantia]|uniref:Protein TIFY n=1 Tax=Momordica charantia TaxID=3673 RepID=A0A6J1BQJ3_MOMCH|nr:protein TIFY 8-like isoform X2 [Momordica charantia]
MILSVSSLSLSLCSDSFCLFSVCFFPQKSSCLSCVFLYALALYAEERNGCFPMLRSLMSGQGASSNAGYYGTGEKKKNSTSNPMFHDFLGIRTKDSSVLLAAKAPDVNLSEASSPSPSALAASSGGRGLFSTASDLAFENQGGDYLEGVPFYSPRNENSNRIAGIKRSINPDSAFMGSYRNQIPHMASDSLERSHSMKMLQNGAAGDRPRYIDNDAVYSMQPPRIASYSLTQHSLGTRFNPSVSKWERPIPMNIGLAQSSPLGSQFVPRVHQVASNSSREFNVAPFSISHPAADEGSRTGMKSAGIFSSINAGHDGRHSAHMLLSCDKQKFKTEGLEHKSSNPISQQRPDSINRQMTIFYSGKAHVFDEVHPNKADIIMALAGSNGGSWSTTLASKPNVTGISSDQESAREYREKLYCSTISSRGVSDNPILTQAAFWLLVVVAGDCPSSIPAKETREPVRAAELNAER